MTTETPRRLPSESQIRSRIEDPRDVDSIELTDAVIRTGWFPHEDGRPLWFAECRWKGGYCVMEYGDTRDEAFARILTHSDREGRS